MKVKRLLKKIIFQVPSTENEWKKIQNDFSIRWNIPFCCGAIDGTHVVIQNPLTELQICVVLLAAVDANYCFIYINVGANGRMNDASIINKSSFNEAISTNQLNLPKKCCFYGRRCFSVANKYFKTIL